MVAQAAHAEKEIPAHAVKRACGSSIEVVWPRLPVWRIDNPLSA